MKPTVKQVVEQVRALAAESPDFVYDRTVRYSYFPDEQNPQGCIVGAALARLGVTENYITEGVPADRVVAYACESGYNDFNLSWLYEVQQNQDGGASWSQAVADADREHEEA